MSALAHFNHPTWGTWVSDLTVRMRWGMCMNLLKCGAGAGEVGIVLEDLIGFSDWCRRVLAIVRLIGLGMWW